MNRNHAAQLLDRIGVLRTRCDLDLLIFFAGHPRVMLASETLAALLGYELGDIAESLDALLGAGLLERRQTSAHAARLYVFVPAGLPGADLPPLLELAGTRAGRLALRAALPAAPGQPAGPRRIDETPASQDVPARNRHQETG